MAKSIEIYENTLLKLIVRQGPDSQRKQIILDAGELGYSTDTKRLYIGDGSTAGGVPAGNKFKGEQTTVSNIATSYGDNSEVGDLAFATNLNYLYKLTSLPGTTVSNWTKIGGIYNAGNGTIVISDTSVIVGKISAGNIDSNATTAPIYINGSNKIALSATIPADIIVKATASELTLPSDLKINNNIYHFPSNVLLNNTFARIQADGTLSWTKLSAVDISTNTITVTNGLTATGNGLPITGVATNPLTSTVVIGVDSSILSAVNAFTLNSIYWTEKWGILTIADGSLLSSFDANSSLLSATRMARGEYKFSYPTTNLSKPFVLANVISDNLGWFAKVTESTNTYCIVKVVSLANLFARYDLPVSVLIKDKV